MGFLAVAVEEALAIAVPVAVGRQVTFFKERWCLTSSFQEFDVHKILPMLISFVIIKWKLAIHVYVYAHNLTVAIEPLAVTHSHVQSHCC